VSDIIYGRNPVLEALRAGREINKIYLSSEERGTILEVVKLARQRAIPLHQTDRQNLDRLAQTDKHQGIVAFVASAAYVDIDDLFAVARERQEAPFLLVLDEVEDPHNLGAILRTADATGAHGLIIPKRRAVGLTGTAAKASAGAVEHVGVARVTNIVQTLSYLKEQGCWVVGAETDSDLLPYGQDLTGPIALVIGGEGKGLGRLVKENCDYLIRLPMRGRLNSLNASVAAGVLMYEVLRQRMGALEQGRPVNE